MVVPLILEVAGPFYNKWGSGYSYEMSDEESGEYIGTVKNGIISISSVLREECHGKSNYIYLKVMIEQTNYIDLFIFDNDQNNLLSNIGEKEFVFQKNFMAFRYYTDKIRSLQILSLEREDKRSDYAIKFYGIQKLVEKRELITDWLIEKGYEDVIISYLKDIEFIISDRFDFSDDYRTIRKNGIEFHLTPMQAGIIQLLMIHIERDLGLGGQYLLENIDSKAKRLRDVFKGNLDAFKALIQYDNRTRIYKINLQ